MEKNLILKALANPTRLEILTRLKNPERYFSSQQHPLDMGVCAGEFERLGLSQSTISSHLGELLKAGLLTSRRIGQWVFYQRNEQAIREFLVHLDKEL